MVIANFLENEKVKRIAGLDQYDYGQVLRIQGLKLPTAVEIHFGLEETGGTTTTRIGVTKDGVTDVVIPDSMLENGDTSLDYAIYAFVYLTDETSGKTVRRIKIQVKARSKPEQFDKPNDTELFHKVIKVVNDSAERAEKSANTAEENALKTNNDSVKTGEDRIAVEKLVSDAKITEGQVIKYAGQAQSASEKALLSEQEAKKSEEASLQHRTGAETAENNAELAEQNAKKSEQAVEQAKQLVMQMGQKVLDNKNHVDGKVEAFNKNVKDASDAINTKKTESLTEIKTAKTDAVNAVGTKGAEQTKEVAAEGTKQVGAVNTEAQKHLKTMQEAVNGIVTDRQQITQNKEDVTTLKEDLVALDNTKADGIIETARGETIKTEISSDSKLVGLNVYGKSEQNGVPSPQSPVPITNIGDKGNVNAKITGKNLLNLQYYSAATTNSIEEEPALTNNYGTEISTTEAVNKVVVKQKKIVDTESPISYKNGFMIFAFKDDFVVGKSYNLSFDLEVLNNPLRTNETMILVNGAYTQRANIQKRVKTQFQYQKKEARKFIELRCCGMDFVLSNIMITEVDCDYNYETYHDSQTVTLSTPSGLPGIKVEADGNYTDSTGQQWVCDEIDLARGKYVQRIVNTVLNSDFADLTVGTHDNGTKFLGVRLKIKAKKDSVIMCERYKGTKWTNKNGCAYAPNNNSIIITDNRFTDLETAKKIINTEPSRLLYIINNPIERDLTPEEISAYKSMHTNYPTTVVSNDESAHMEVSYVADTKNYIVSKIETPLQKQITDLQNALISQKISGGGIKVNNSSRLPVEEFVMQGKTEQMQTTGANLFDISKAKVNLFKLEVWAKEAFNNEFVMKTFKPNTRYFIKYKIKMIKAVTGKKLYNRDKSLLMYKEGSPTTIIIREMKEMKDGEVITGSNTFTTPSDLQDYRILAYTERYTEEDGTGEFVSRIAIEELIISEQDTPYEPYTGGKPSPSPDYSQPIETTPKGVITVDFTDGTNHQAVDLNCPRDFTKWDRLEKIDGAWNWVFKSRRYIITGNEEFVAAGEEYITGSSTNFYTNVVQNAERQENGFMERLQSVNAIWSKINETGFCINAAQLHMRLPNTLLGVSDTTTKEEKKTAYVNYLKAEYKKGTPYSLMY